jgi:uncharacterized RDD family membrane protein YckC
VTQPPTYESAHPPPAGSYSSGPSGPRSGFWRRFWAVIVDALVLAIPDAIIIYVIFKDTHAAGQGVTTLVAWLYGTLMEGSARGQTVGKMALGIRVYDFKQGGSIGYSRGFVRQIVKTIAAIPLFLGWFWMLWDKEKQCWQDKAATDVVVPVSAYS